MTLHPRAAGIFLLDDPLWRSKVFTGGLILLVPIFGWPVVIGYRAALVRRLLGQGAHEMPGWRDSLGTHLREGLKAMGVIFGFLAPLYLGLAIVVVGRGYVPGAEAAWVLACFLAYPIFSTLSLPAACVLFARSTPALLSTGECAGFLFAYAAIIFLIPAGFLRVSVTGRYASAFNPRRTLGLVLSRPRAYCEAWVHASIMSLAGHFAIPISPWGVVWAYCGIVFLFNELIVGSPEAGAGCWLARARSEGLGALTSASGIRTLRDGAGTPVSVFFLGPLAAPLPLLRRKG